MSITKSLEGARGEGDTIAVAKNIGAGERWARLTGGGLLVLAGFSLAGWAGWVSGLAGLALVLTSAVRY